MHVSSMVYITPDPQIVDLEVQESCAQTTSVNIYHVARKITYIDYPVLVNNYIIIM